MAVIAKRHDEFLRLGGRVYGLSADTVPMNTAVVEKLALPFPILSDPDRTGAITPLGFADDEDPRRISLPATVIVDPSGEIAYSVTGRDYADRPDESVLLGELEALDLPPTTQEPPALGESEPGERAIPLEGIPHYLRGAKFATLAIRRRHRELSDEVREDLKRYVHMVERYLDALPAVEERRS